MLAKIITHAATRLEAIALMRQALTECVIEGVTTNIALHQHILDTEHVQDGHLDTDFLFTKLYP